MAALYYLAAAGLAEGQSQAGGVALPKGCLCLGCYLRLFHLLAQRVMMMMMTVLVVCSSLHGSGARLAHIHGDMLSCSTASHVTSADRVALHVLLHLFYRFEELAYADAASYMEDGKVVFTGSPAQMTARLKAMGASIR